MKKSIQSVIAISILFIAVSFKSASAQEGKTKMDSWKEMAAFHEIMAKTFHPAEEGNLKPLKEMSGELAKRAEAWSASTPPKEMGDIHVEGQLKELASNCAEVDKMVQGNIPDEELKQSITKLHDQFHAIVGACMKGEKAEHHDKDVTPENKK